MSTRNFDDGVEITLPPDFEIATPRPSTAKRSAKQRMRGFVPMPSSQAQTQDGSLLLGSLKESGLELVREVEFKPKPQGRARRTRAVTTSKVAEIAVDLKPNEESIILLEQDGLFLWKYADSTQAKKSTRRRGMRAESTGKRQVFKLEIEAQRPPSTTRKARGLKVEPKELAWGWAKASILKFTASKTIEIAKKLLEKNVRTGLVGIDSVSPDNSKPLKKLKVTTPLKGRAPRILLLIHGTFSSTVGCYGALGNNKDDNWGKKLLRSAFKHYDAVIGFDHATLSQSPLENAQYLLDQLEAVNWAEPPVFDVVAHSRGGLVIRSLIELLMPQSNLKAKFNRVIFVGCTNEGTLLAEQKNWKHLINLYTNLVVGGCRVISLISPQSKVAAAILSETMKNIGSFVQYCTDLISRDEVIPGLAAMVPNGEFVRNINLFQPGQPAIAESNYYAVTSDFKPSLKGDHEPKELPKRFFLLTAGGFMGQLMKEANDLVVNVASMSAIDRSTGKYIQDKNRYDFGENPQVYHTNYFTRPEVCNALARWLSRPPLDSKTGSKTKVGAKRGPGSGGRGKRRTRPSTIPLATTGSLNAPAVLPPIVDTDIILANVTSSVTALRDEIAKHAPSYVVVRKPHKGNILNYAFTGEETLELLGRKKNDSISDVLKLAEDTASVTRSGADRITRRIGMAAALPSPGNAAHREVILAGDVPVGVVPEMGNLPSANDLAEMARIVSDPKTDSERIITRRTMPTFVMDTEKVSSKPAEAGSKAKVTCHFHAEMDAEVVVNRAVTVCVTISREMIEALTSEASAVGVGEVSMAKKILVQVVPKSNFITIDENGGRAEIDVPQPREPRELFFDLRALKKGEGEIWVLARQGQVPIVKLVLKPEVVKTQSYSSEKVSANKNANEPRPLSAPLHQLWIHERTTEEGIVYEYELYSEGLKIRKWVNSPPIKGDRDKYVKSLYQQIEDRWVSSHQDEENFAQELRAFGADLFDELIPAELQKILWKRRRDFDSIQVISSEPFIPWELVHLKDPDKKGMPREMMFMGQMGLIRWLEGAGEDGWPPEQIKIRNERARYVIPNYPEDEYKLEQAEMEENFLRSKFSATAVKPESGAVRTIISKPGRFDLLHFACHGSAESDNISKAALLMRGKYNEKGEYIEDPFTATVAESFSNLKSGDNSPMVVLNACQVGRTGYKLSGIGGFANAFLSGGAGAFVGTLWSVGDEPARTFTETLYKCLLTGSNLSEATIKARNAAKEAGEATWLAYVVYGHPHLKISR